MVRLHSPRTFAFAPGFCLVKRPTFCQQPVRKNLKGFHAFSSNSPSIPDISIWSMLTTSAEGHMPKYFIRFCAHVLYTEHERWRKRGESSMPASQLVACSGLRPGFAVG